MLNENVHQDKIHTIYRNDTRLSAQQAILTRLQQLIYIVHAKLTFNYTVMK